jgi:DNA-binding NarL/FixJ family response regulator
MLRLLLVDSHTSFRQSLAFMLEREPDLIVIGHTGSLAEARSMFEQGDVAIIDLNLPGGDGLTLMKELTAINPRCQVLVVTGSSASTDYARAVTWGAAGVLHKSADIQHIITAVRRLGAGRDVLSRQEIAGILQRANEQAEQYQDAQTRLKRLTLREWDVLRALAEGRSDRGIGEKLQISTETARSHVVSILSKLEVHSRLQALVFALRYGGVTVG